MSETKFTPGPWLLSTNPIETNDHAASIYGPYLNGGAPFICDVSRSPGSEQALGNAKLIAAAPDMYTELQDTHEHLLRLYSSINGRSMDFETILQELRDRMVKQRIVIEKATN